MKVSAKPGSTRKEMTKEELAWLRKFDQAFSRNDRKALKELTSDISVSDKVKKDMNDSMNASQRDIWNNALPIYIEDNAHHERIVLEAESGSFLTPKRIDPNQYTEYDYINNFCPTEDMIIAAIDFDKRRKRNVR